MPVRKTSVEIDVDLLAEAQQLLSTATIRETIQEAFRALLREEARRTEVEALRSMQGMDLADSAIMAGAWRR